MRRAFTLIELLISVAILGFALVVVIQSYIASAQGLNISENYVQAMRLAEAKITEIELSAYENNGLEPYGPESGSQHLGTRDFNWSYEVKEINEPADLSENLVEVCLQINWKERGLDKDASLAAYLPKSKEE